MNISNAIGASELFLNEFYGKSSSSALEWCHKIHLEIIHLCSDPRN